MGTRTDGKPTRLRASCDACNESKVRCSQSRPTCARCDKQGITCIYGLSRRTHKNAPRIGDQTVATIPPSTTSATSISNRDDEMLSSSPGSLLSLPYPALSDSTRATSIMSDANFPSDHLGTLSDSFLLSLPPSSLASSGQHAQQHIGLGPGSPALDLSVGPDPLSDLDRYNFLHQCHLSLPMDVDQLEQQPSKESGECDQNKTETQRALSNLAAPGEGNAMPCSCQSQLMKQLAAMPQAFQDHGAASFEVRLCEIQKAVKVVERCMQCTCTLQNYVAILMISTLIGYIIQGFEKALPRAGAKDPAADGKLNGTSGGRGQHEHTTPRLSWGMLQIEPDDEDKLKRHLWLLHFRKFRRMLVHFNESIGQLKGTESREKLAQIAAYQFIYKWLEHELDNVTSQYQVQEGTGEGRLSKN